MVSMMCVNCNTRVDIIDILANPPDMEYTHSIPDDEIDAKGYKTIRCSKCGQSHRVMVPKEYRKQESTKWQNYIAMSIICA